MDLHIVPTWRPNSKGRLFLEKCILVQNTKYFRFCKTKKQSYVYQNSSHFLYVKVEADGLTAKYSTS